jgi:shikimate dehydrogenase
MTTAHRAAVLGKPIAHSLSPVIHNAGYRAAGLRDWSYTAIECAEAELPGLVAALGPEWAGLSLTMPLKEVALGVADEISEVARAAGAVNTLVRRGDGGWRGDNTDVPGMVTVLTSAGVPTRPTVTVLGAGGTARAAVAAAARLSPASITVVARRPAAIEALRPIADASGVPVRGAQWPHAVEHCGADVLISTVPAGVADELAGLVDWSSVGFYFDVLYHPWPTPMATAAQAAGRRIGSGLDLLLAQAVEQFVQFTGVTAPVAAMRQALTAARVTTS